MGQCFSLQVEAKLKKLRYHKVDKNELQLKIELHGFSDASLKTCGAVICWRCLSKSSNITTNLIASKSRIAPIKPTTLAWLQLGNLFLGQIMKNVKKKKPLKISATQLNRIFEQIPRLSRIFAVSKIFKVFIPNRFKEIRTWKYFEKGKLAFLLNKE